MASDRSPFKTSILTGISAPASRPSEVNPRRYHVDEVALLAQDHFLPGNGSVQSRKPKAGFESRARYLGAV